MKSRFGTGGPDGSRVFYSRDDGKTWSVSKTPLQNGSTSGVFSLSFSDARDGLAAGGDYKMDSTTTGTLAITKDSGKTWTSVPTASGFRSDIAYLPEFKLWISVGSAGSDVSTDGGLTWRKFGPGFNAISFTAGATGWAVGPGGSIAKFKPYGMMSGLLELEKWGLTSNFRRPQCSENIQQLNWRKFVVCTLFSSPLSSQIFRSHVLDSFSNLLIEHSHYGTTLNAANAELATTGSSSFDNLSSTA